MTEVGENVIVVGGGHNGLVCAFYLARAGHDVTVLERNERVGGACITEPLVPGYQVSSCAYLAHLLQDKVARDMDLARHGLEVIQTDPHKMYVWPDGDTLGIWRDPERTGRDIAKFDERDAEGWLAYNQFWDRATAILNRYFLQDPPTIAQVFADLRDTEDEAIFERMLTTSMERLVKQHFRHPRIRGAMMDNFDMADPAMPGGVLGWGLVRCDHYSDPALMGVPRGGMGAITRAMASAVEEAGGTIRRSAPVTSIVTEDGHTAGVELADGQFLPSGLVVSNADPKTTLLGLVNGDGLPTEDRVRVESYDQRLSCVKWHAILTDLPDFSRFFGSDYERSAVATLSISPTLDTVMDAYADARAGRVSKNMIMELQIPTVVDDTIAPEGKHIFSSWCLWAPSQLRDGRTWDEARPEIDAQITRQIAGYLPDIEGLIEETITFTPGDIQSRHNLRGGVIRQLDVHPGQVLANRQPYASGIDGLYLCGNGTHPGVDVSGAAGHNAAHAILRTQAAVQATAGP